MAYRSVDEEYVEKLAEMGLNLEAIAIHTELVCRGKMSGLVAIPFKSFCSRLGCSEHIFRTGLKNLARISRVEVDYEHELIWLVGFVEHQWLAKGKLSFTIKRAILNEYNGLPNTHIREAFREKYPTLFDTPSDTISDTPNDTSEEKSRLKLKVLKLKEESLNKDIPASPQNKAQPESEARQILNTWIEKARATHRRIFGKDIEPKKICLLAYGRNGSRKDCFGEIDVLIKFWESLAGQKVEDSFTWSLTCAKNPETVNRFVKAL